MGNEQNFTHPNNIPILMINSQNEMKTPTEGSRDPNNKNMAECLKKNAQRIDQISTLSILHSLSSLICSGPL